MSYTNSGLVKYCNQVLNIKTKYMWGAVMQKITNGKIAYFAEKYSAQYPADRQAELRKCVGTYYGVDCHGLVKSYYWGGVGSPLYGRNGNPDTTIEVIYKKATVKGRMKDFDKVIGRCVMTSNFGHIGVYVGNGMVIESTFGSRGDGVVKSRLSDVDWYYWMQNPYIIDDTSGKATGNDSGKKPVKTTYKTVCTMYKSLGCARKRDKPGLDGAEKGRCEKGKYYPAVKLVSVAGSAQKWFQHTDGKYSAMTDTDGSRLFESAGSYTVGKATAPVRHRAGAGLSYQSYCTIPAGEKVYLMGSEVRKDGTIEWRKVVYQGKAGWCDRKWIK